MHAPTHFTDTHASTPTPTRTRTLTRQGQVTAVVGFNPSKKYDVSPEQRVELIERACRDDPDLQNVRAKVVSGYIWRYAFANKITRMYRGIRSWVSRRHHSSWGRHQAPLHLHSAPPLHAPAIP
jgi:hypothetical protein